MYLIYGTIAQAHLFITRTFLKLLLLYATLLHSGSQMMSWKPICFLLLLELFPILIETRKLTLVSRPRCAEN